MTTYDPKLTCYPYRAKTDKHYLTVKKQSNIVFDEKYPYVDYGLGYKVKSWFMRLLDTVIAFPIMSIRYGLKIYGRDNLKKHREEIKKGVVSVVNHVLMWDFIAIMRALRPNIPYLPVWDKNMRGENKTLIRYNGGIPLPTENRHATVAFANSIDKLLQDGSWVHFSTEGSMWEYYAPIRPFKKGAFTFAVRNNKPVIPMAFSFRPLTGIHKLFHKRPLVNFCIGEPIYPDLTLPKPTAVDKLCHLAHDEVCRLAGINPEDNIYPAIFNNNDRIDYYPNKNAEKI
ncbi:MAG: lysophospholipid acyltransferase family protein [Clostridia bacterium]